MAKLTLTDIAAGFALITTINANNALIEAALENTVSRDGTTPNTMTGALDANSQAINNLPDATQNQQPVTLGQLTAAQTASLTSAAASIVTITDTAGDYVSTTVEGALAEIWTLLASVANGEGASFLGVEDSGGFLAATDVEAAIAELFATPTATSRSLLELATQAEVDAGTDAVRAVTPATLEAKPDGPLVVNVDTSTSIAPALADANSFYTASNGSAIAFVIPANASVAYDIGTTFLIKQLGAGQVTVSVTSDTLNAANGAKTALQHSVVAVVKETATSWTVFGDTTT